jgi:hypothetical protein
LILRKLSQERDNPSRASIVKKVKPTDQTGEQQAEIDVSFKKPHSSDKEVTVFGDGDSFTIPVKIVH